MAIRKPVKLADAPELRPATQAPKCPRHGGRMQYRPEKGAWNCIEVGCKMVARPDTEIEGKPILGKGQVAFVVDHDPYRIWAKAANNVMVELTGFISADNIVLTSDGKVGITLAVEPSYIINVADMVAS